MSTTAELQWWKDTYNATAHSINNAYAVEHITIDNGSMQVKTVRRPSTYHTLRLPSHHLRYATGTPRAEFICAYAAHREAWDETHSRTNPTWLWKTLLALAAIASVAAISHIASAQYNAVFIFAIISAVVLTLLAIPVARWSFADQREAFYSCLNKAITTAGAAAAEDYVKHDSYLHRSIIHSVEKGLPITPNRLYAAITAAAAARKKTSV